MTHPSGEMREAARGQRTVPRSLRVGVMLSPAGLRAWELETLGALLAVEGVELELVLQDATPAASGPAPTLLSRARSPQLLFRLYREHVLRPPAMAPVDAAPLVAGVPVLRCAVEREGPVDRFSAADLAAVHAHGVDVLLRFGFNILRGGILDAARFGVWSFHHGDEQRYRGHPACFWEIYRGDPVTGAILQRLTERLDAGIVLRKGHFRTQPSSLVASRNQVLLGGVDWPAEVARDILAGRGAYVDGSPSTTTASLDTAPTNRQMLRFGLRTARSFATMHAERRLRRERWNVGIVRRPITSFLDMPTLADAEWRPVAGAESLADPFGVVDRDTSHVLCERFGGALGAGELAAVRPAAQGWHASIEPALRLESHASYPFIVQQDGAVFCVPERRRADEIAAFRAERLPDRWTKAAVLVEGVAGVDPTIVRHEDRWWLFFTDWHRDSTLRLFVHHAESLHGPWRPHARNPVKTDVRSARPGGTPFTHDGALFRPAQDCSRSYGGCVVINRVARLSPEEFAEEPVATVAPDPHGPYPDGAHTLSALGDVTLVDGRRDAYPWSRR